MDGGHPPHS